MNTNLTIKNFRVFDEEGVTIELTPITILTGCNSSGKSSIVKAVLFLNDFLSQIKKDYDNGEPITLEKYKIDFSKYPINLLGRFDKVVHKGSSKKEVTIAYTTYSRMLSKDVNVEFVFSGNKNDMLNNAYLKKMTLSTEDGVFYTSYEKNLPLSKSKSCLENGVNTDYEVFNLTEINLYMLKDACLEFLFLEHYIYKFLSHYEDEYPSDEEILFQPSLFKEEKLKLRLKDVAEHFRFYAEDEVSIILKCIQSIPYDQQNKSDRELETKIIEWTRHNGSLFYIPLVEELDKYSKDEIEEYINKNILNKFPQTKKGQYDFYKSTLNNIVKDFVQSKFDKFSTYFREYEKEYLQKEIFVGTFSLNVPNINQHNRLLHKEEKFKPIKFEYIYEVLMFWNKKLGFEADFYYFNFSDFDYCHIMYDFLREYFNNLIIEILTPSWSGRVDYASSSRTTIKRLYSLDDHDDFTRLLKKYFEKRKNCKDRIDQIKKDPLEQLFSEEEEEKEEEEEEISESMEFMNNWVKEFLGKSIIESLDDEGFGVLIRLKKPAEKEGNLLADEGYGISQLFSILLQIQTGILSKLKKRERNSFNILKNELESIGIQLDNYQYDPQIIAIEEPEIHLHPALQSKLADMFLDAYQNHHIHFILETHSEYLIRKFQVMVADKGNALSPNDVSINYVEKEENGVSSNRKIDILEDGRLSDSFGSGFYDEADTLALDLFRKKPILS